jgi:hypothetical protein
VTILALSNRRVPVADAAFIATGIGFFVIGELYVLLCGRL